MDQKLQSSFVTPDLPWDFRNERARANEYRRLAARLMKEKIKDPYSAQVIGPGQGGTSIVARKLRADGGLTWR